MSSTPPQKNQLSGEEQTFERKIKTVQKCYKLQVTHPRNDWSLNIKYINNVKELNT